MTSRNESIKAPGLPVLELVFICIFGIFYIDFEVQGKYKVIAPFIALLYLFYCYLREPKQRGRIVKFIFACAIVAILYQILTIPITIRGANAASKYLYSNFSQYLLAFFPLAFLYRTDKLATANQIKIIVGVIIITAIALIQVALKFAAINPDILHSMNQEVLEDAGVTLQGFDFVYAFTFLIITCFVLIKQSDSKIIRYLSIGALIYFIHFLLKAQFALAFVATFISCLYLYYTTTRNKGSRFFVIIGLSTLIFLIPYILERLIDMTQDLNVLNVRLKEIYDSISGNHAEDSDMQARFDLYWKCIVAFFNSPIMGNKYLPFNGHSTFLLAFAYLGIFGGVLICWMFYKGSKFVQSILGNDQYVYFKPLMCQIILMGLTNPIQSTPSNFIMLFFVSPLLIKRCVKQ